MMTAIREMDNTLEEINRLDEGEDLISDLGDKVSLNNQSEQHNEIEDSQFIMIVILKTNIGDFWDKNQMCHLLQQRNPGEERGRN